MQNIKTIDGLRSTELWLTATTGVVEVILISAAPSNITIALSVCLTAAAITYLICRTCFKIAKLKYAPDSAVEFAAHKTDSSKRTIIG